MKTTLYQYVYFFCYVAIKDRVLFHITIAVVKSSRLKCVCFFLVYESLNHSFENHEQTHAYKPFHFKLQYIITEAFHP